MADAGPTHRLQPCEQPSPVLLVIKQAVDLPPIGRVRVVLLAQDVVERVSHAHDHPGHNLAADQPSRPLEGRFLTLAHEQLLDAWDSSLYPPISEHLGPRGLPLPTPLHTTNVPACPGCPAWA